MNKLEVILIILLALFCAITGSDLGRGGTCTVKKPSTAKNSPPPQTKSNPSGIVKKQIEFIQHLFHKYRKIQIKGVNNV